MEFRATKVRLADEKARKLLRHTGATQHLEAIDKSNYMGMVRKFRENVAKSYEMVRFLSFSEAFCAILCDLKVRWSILEVRR